MKIAHICFWYYPAKVSGATVTVNELAKRQLARGNRVMIFTTRWEGTKAQEVLDGIPIRRVNRCLTRYFHNFPPSLLPALCRENPDIIHVQAIWGHVPIAFLASKFRNSKFILQPQGTWQFIRRRRIDTVYLNTLWRLIVEFSNAYLALNADEAKFAHHCGASKEKVHIIPNGVDAMKYQPTSAHYFSKMGVEGDVILFVGAMEQRKGIDTIIESIPLVREEFPKATFVFVGRGDIDVKRLAAEIEVDDRVLVLGPKHGKELVDIYSSADIFLAPSIYEPFGIVLIEAMACEKPVISTSVGGPKEIISDGIDGFLINPGDANALAGRITQLLEDKEMRVEMGRRARQKVLEKYTWDTINERVLQVYDKCL